MRSTDVDQMLANITGMFMWLSETKSMTFRLSKTVSNILITCPIASEEIHTFCVCVWFHKFSTKSKKSHKLLISSEAMGHRMRMLDTVLERPKFILFIFASHMNVMLGNIWSLFVDHKTKISKKMNTDQLHLPPPLFADSNKKCWNPQKEGGW